MQTIDTILTEALYELDAIPGGTSELEVIIDAAPDAREIKIQAMWYGDMIPATRYGNLAGPAEYREIEGEDATEWDGETPPELVLEDLFGFIDDDVWADQEPDVSIFLPAAAADALLAAYLDQGNDDAPVVMFSPGAFPADTPSLDYREWRDAMNAVANAQPPRSTYRHKATPNAAFTAGLWAGVELGKAIAAAARLDATLEANGHPAAFTWLTTPQIVTVDTVKPGFSARLVAARDARHALTNPHGNTA